jgi:hypothetical protein
MDFVPHRYLQATLQQADEDTASEERCFATEPELPARYKRPHDHLSLSSSVLCASKGVETGFD